MQEHEKIVKKVKQKIKPTTAETKKVDDIINFSKEKVQKEMLKQKIDAEIFVGGSVAKNTWTKGQHDIDIFIRFEKKHKNIGGLLKKIVKKVFKNVKVLHGSRDYCKINYRGYELEFVPVYKIKKPSEAENSMDASLFHVEFVKNKIKENPKLADEIRVFKEFARAQRVYGAETHISGISGYVSELLIIHYKSFLNFIKESEKMKPKIFIDINKHYKNNSEIVRKLSKSKLYSPIIIIDPVLKERNAAAALESEVFSNLILSSRLFFRKPSLNFFKKKRIGIKEIKNRSSKRKTLLVVKKIKKEYAKEDVFLAKLKKALKKVNKHLLINGISVSDYGYFIDKNKIDIFFELETKKLSKYRKHIGPPVWITSSNFDKFLDKHKNIYISGENLACDIKREFEDVKKFVSKCLDKEISIII